MVFRKREIKKAEALEVQAMAVRPAAGRDLDLIDAQILANAGTIYQRQRRNAKAEEAYQQSLEISERVLGPSHPDLTLTLGNLGILYSEMGRYGDAEDRYRRSLVILEHSSPALDLRMSRTLHYLARNYVRKEERCRAEEALAKAVQISRRHTVSDPEMPQLLETYSGVLKSLGRTQESQRLRDEARRIRTASALTVRAPR
jgi:tetratricopeptide (TPR) repeat protein